MVSSSLNATHGCVNPNEALSTNSIAKTTYAVSFGRTVFRIMRFSQSWTAIVRTCPRSPGIVYHNNTFVHELRKRSGTAPGSHFQSEYLHLHPVVPSLKDSWQGRPLWLVAAHSARSQIRPVPWRHCYT